MPQVMPPKSPAQLQAEARAQSMSSAALQAVQAQPTTVVEEKKYYQPYNGSRFIMPSGKVLTFVNGCLATNIKEEIDEIEKAIASGAEISRIPMNVIKSDATLLREVGASSRGRTSGTGMATSQTIAALAAESNSGNK